MSLIDNMSSVRPGSSADFAADLHPEETWAWRNPVPDNTRRTVWMAFFMALSEG